MKRRRALATSNPFFLSSQSGKIFCNYIVPQKSSSHAVLFFPPFAEELNKCRRMMFLTATRVASKGYASLLVDLFGTGDSAGDLPNASWTIWQRDMLAAAKWLRNRGHDRLTLIAVRFGTLLTLSIYPELRDIVERIILWQPTFKGAAVIRDFHRLKLAEEILEAGNNQKTQLNEGQNEFVEIAGYRLSQKLLSELTQSDAETTCVPSCPVYWFEIVPFISDSGAIPHRPLPTSWQKARMDLKKTVVLGERFWSTPVVTRLPDLIDQTSALLSERKCEIQWN